MYGKVDYYQARIACQVPRVVLNLHLLECPRLGFQILQRGNSNNPQ